MIKVGIPPILHFVLVHFPILHIVLVHFPIQLFFISSWCNSSYSSYRPCTIHLILQIVQVQNNLRKKELNQFCPPPKKKTAGATTSALSFCLYPFSLLQTLGFWLWTWSRRRWTRLTLDFQFTWMVNRPDTTNTEYWSTRGRREVTNLCQTAI